jgi:diacylglycerol O-acyltransferase / wax synthase
VKRLNGMDSMLLYSETPNPHSHTLKVAVIDAAENEFGFDLFRQTLADRLHRLDPLCYKLIDIPWRLHHPMWLEKCHVDLRLNRRPRASVFRRPNPVR